MPAGSRRWNPNKMNLQKDLIQHIAVLTVAPGYLNFAQRRSTDVLHMGLSETKLLLRDCLGILAVEDTAGASDVFRWAWAAGGQEADAVLNRYAQAFRQAAERIDASLNIRWNNETDALCDMERVMGDLDSFLAREHWYDVDQARLICFPDGTFYQNCSRFCPNRMANWHCASVFPGGEVAQCVLDRLKSRYSLTGTAVPLVDYDPPRDYLWRARTYAPQGPQSLINYWEAMLPGSRRLRIKQMVNQQQA